MFSSDRSGNGQIYEMDANGSNVRRLTFNSAREWYPAYSADATLIVFMSDREHTFQIYAMNAAAQAR